MKIGWQERLEELRREQNPGRYSEERPVIHLPAPDPAERRIEKNEEKNEEEDRGWIKIQL